MKKGTDSLIKEAHEALDTDLYNEKIRMIKSKLQYIQRLETLIESVETAIKKIDSATTLSQLDNVTSSEEPREREGY